MRKVILIIVLFSVNISMFSQEFSRKDSLRGELTPLRTCYDVTFYNLDVTIDEKERFIERSFNEIHFIATADFETFQIDLAENMEILIIEFEQTDLDFEREFPHLADDRPLCLILDTIKGKGVSFMEHPDWHCKVPTDKEYEIAMKELGV